MKDDFYAFFESLNYASEEQVRNNRQIYTAYAKPLLSFLDAPLAFDFGCGRGEWLDMMREIGFRAKGVDIDRGMLKSAKNKGLDVEEGDGSTYLQALPDKSVSVLSAFHVLEHITFDKILHFFLQSQRVLVPGGILIVETPNPECLQVATSNFYLDPTHIRPIPILQMLTLARYFHYDRHVILRLQEDNELPGKQDVTFHDLFYGVSKDYGLVAQKSGGAEGLTKALDNPLKYETGVGVDEVLKRLDMRLDTLSKKVQEFEKSGRLQKNKSQKDST